MEDFKNYSKDLKEILDYTPDGNLVISVYLRVESSKILRQDYITSLNSMITEAKGNIESNTNIDKIQKRNLSDLLEKIKRYINDVFRPESAKTIIIYAGITGLWKLIRLPLNLKSKILRRTMVVVSQIDTLVTEKVPTQFFQGFMTLI